jgi:hypothetical protein
MRLASKAIYSVVLGFTFALPLSVTSTSAQSAQASESLGQFRVNTACAGGACDMINPFAKCCDGGTWSMGTWCSATGPCGSDDCQKSGDDLPGGGGS